jgi:hypothetical protein
MLNYRIMTNETEVKVWCSRIELGVCIEIVAFKSIRNIECKSVVAPDIANATSGMKFLPRAYTS